MPSRPALESRPLHEAPPERTSVGPENPERKAWLADKYGHVFGDPRFARLRAALTSHGGWDLVPDPTDPHLDSLITERATVWDGRGARWTTGEPNRCHGNAAYRFLRSWPRYMVATGYALRDDGVWTGHTWLAEHTGGQPTRIVETTVGRLLYAGVVLDPAGVANPIGRAFLPGGPATMRFALGNIDSLDQAPALTEIVDAVVAKDPRFLAVLAAIAGGSVSPEHLCETIKNRQAERRAEQRQAQAL